MDTQSFDEFVPRLRSLEGTLNAIRRDLALTIHLTTEDESIKQARTQLNPATEPETPAASASTPPPPPPRPTKPAWTGLEQFVGGKALNLAGLLLVFLGTGFFLKVAFDNNWIAPPERIAMGVIAGIALIVYAQCLAMRESGYFSDGITALGAAIEFLSLYAAGPLFHLFSPGEVFVGMAAVSAAVAALGWRHRSERLGILGAVAGFLTPLLIGATQSNDWMLASYLAVFATGLLVLGELLESNLLAPLALAGTLFYGIAHFFGAALPAIERVEILGLLYGTFAITGWIVGRLRSSDEMLRTTLSFVALGAYLVALFGLVPEDRTVLATILFVLAAAHCGASAFLRSRYEMWMSAAALTLALPVAFDGAALAAGWAIETIALVTVGLFRKDDVLRVAGLVLLGFTLVHTFALETAVAVQTPIWNGRFLSLLAVVAGLFGANAILALKPFRSVQDEALRILMRLAGHAVALWMLTAEVWDYAGSGALSVFGSQGASAAVSILWALYATVMIASGLKKRDTILRWAGLSLIVAATGKVLIFDLSSLDFIYRVLSGILVGIALIGVSYAYQRRANV